MTTRNLAAAEQRLQRLLDQKKALEARIGREQGLLRERERKARTRRLIEYGGLVALAALDQEDKATVLGLLLEGARRLRVDAQARQRWQGLGAQALTTRMTDVVCVGTDHALQGETGATECEIPPSAATEVATLATAQGTEGSRRS